MERREFLAAGVGGVTLICSGCLTQEGPLLGNSSYDIMSARVDSERTYPNHPYTLEPTRWVDTNDVNQNDRILKLEELSPELQSVFESAREDSYGADTLPDGTRRVLNQYDLVDYGETNDSWQYVGFELREIDLDTPPRLSITVDLLDDTATPDDPAVFELRAENTSEEPLRWSTGPPRPFGTLYADELLLWADAYAESGHVQTHDGDVVGANDIAVAVTLDSGASISEKYEIQAERDSVGSGVFRADKSFRVSVEQGHEIVTADLTIEID
ncbi:hypothetical protein ACFQJ7_12525 [Halovenus rubra]|uniref:Uncharacterized protein n=2 Tax=Halovenus rubra TaxID=869890 RepID=A0ACC7DZE6_9EURY|nr:hypothetical protein [Halovenus rubra]